MEWKKDANGRSVFLGLGVAFNTDLAAVSFDEIFCYE